MAVYQNDQCGIIKMARHFLPINEKFYLCINMLRTCLKPTYNTSNPESVFSYLAGFPPFHLFPECPIDLKPGCKFKLVCCPKVYKKNWPIRTIKGPWWALFYGRSSRISLAGSILGSILGPMKVQEGPRALVEFHNDLKIIILMFE